MSKSEPGGLSIRRLTPDELLQRVAGESAQKHGRLRVFLGAAPGVGKTYQMLEEGRRMRDSGLDVVVGLVETHGRADTAEQIGDLEIIPRMQKSYRGIEINEMDLQAILARKPETALIDELAHTNIPGSLHAKRYEDVAALRDAGIHVLSTLNIQHLESLNDLVQSVTGVVVRETVPDSVLEDAEIELVDLAPVRLLERLAAGKVYPEERARRAMANFFREENLTALRELALRRTAEGVESTLEGYMRDHEPWPIVEHVLAIVALDADPDTVLRHAWRIARGLHADFTALMYLERPIDEHSEGQRKSLQRHQEVAVDLGARIVEVVDRGLVRAVTREVENQQATDLVIGRPRRVPTRRDMFRRTHLERIVAQLSGITIHVVPIRDNHRHLG